MVRSHALGKALEVASRHKGEAAVVLGADTIVVVDGDILGKPQNATDAAAMLRRLSDRMHTVLSSFTLVDCRDDTTRSGLAMTNVWFRALNDEEIDSYVRTGEPLDKSGAYGIQGRGAVLVAGIYGDFYSVVGLPLATATSELRSLGVVPD